MATRKKAKHTKRHNHDYILLAVVFVLLGFGLMMIFSSSSYDAAIDYSDSAYFFKKQLANIAVGIAAMIVVVIIPYYKWKKMGIVMIVGAFVLLMCLMIPQIAITRNGATRWLKLPGIPFQIQPAEVAKLAVIVYIACMINKIGKKIKTLTGFLYVMVPPTILAAVIYIVSKNLSSAIIVMGIAVAMLFVSVPDYRAFFIAGAAVVVFAAIVVYIAVNTPVSESYRLVRIKAWLNPEDYSTNEAFQTLQALYAIGSGGLWGKGLGQSMQKRGFLPEAQNDMIFSIICEELGFFGAMVVIILFIVLIWCCMVIANHAVDRFGALLVVGVMAHYAIQVILNIAVVTNSIPNTGITLPFISYGGSATVFLLIEIGIVLNVSKTVKEEPQNAIDNLEA